MEMQRIGTQARLLSILTATSPYSGFPGGFAVKNLPVNAGGSGLIPGLGRSPGGGHGYLLQYFCLEGPMNRRVRRPTALGVAKELDTTYQLKNNNKVLIKTD